MAASVIAIRAEANRHRRSISNRIAALHLLPYKSSNPSRNPTAPLLPPRDLASRRRHGQSSTRSRER
ncbi:hypothetical protein ACP70R_038613 [Stipagrostis hirtigluma subsp. patula]